MQSLKVGPNHHGAITAIAASLRRRADERQPAYSTRHIIDACFPGTLVTGRDLPEGVHDVVRIDRHAWRSHRAPHVIVYRRGISSPEQRHAIAHALGHVIFDGAEQKGCGSYSAERELRCDRFADELLAPAADIRAEISTWRSPDPGRELLLDKIDQLASIFHVPSACIARRVRLARSRAVKV